jgi:cephalosporin-C deacetylase
MAVFEMSLEELKKYKGRNPKPSDFDEYWDKALKEIERIDPKLELKKSDFSVSFAECYDLYFTGVGGARIHCKYLKPKNIKSRHPAVLMFHGYTMNSGDWSGKLNYVAAGFSVFAMDCRGQGGLSEDVGGVKGTTFHGHIIRGLDDSPEKLLFRQVFLDTALLAKIVMNLDEIDENRVAATGWSQGGGLTIACASLEPKIKKIAAVYPFLADYQRVWEMDLAVNAYEEIKTYFRLFDPQHKREKEIFTKLGYIDIQHLAVRIKAETLMAVGLMDTICPPSTQFAVFNKITSKKHLILYPDFGHENLPELPDIIFKFITEM